MPPNRRRPPQHKLELPVIVDRRPGFHLPLQLVKQAQ
jgi:hypothetical protein